MKTTFILAVFLTAIYLGLLLGRRSLEHDATHMRIHASPDRHVALQSP